MRGAPHWAPFLIPVIPTFPNFKKLNIHDREAVDALIDHRRPYASFNFTNIWAWDTKYTRLVSTHNGNLIFLFTDYSTHEPFLTFCGTQKPAHTALDLIEFARENDLSHTLRFIPEEVARELSTDTFEIIEDHNNSDYIFSTEALSHSTHPSLKAKRMLIQKFVRENPRAIFEVNVLDTKAEKDAVEKLIAKWKHNKTIGKKDFDIAHEEIALSRLLQNADKHRLIISHVTLDGVMIAFSVDEILPHGYAMGHFIKADVSYKGIYEFLNARTAGYLYTNETPYWNWQQDLGLDGLRKYKQSYRPDHMLKKFLVRAR